MVGLKNLIAFQKLPFYSLLAILGVLFTGVAVWLAYYLWQFHEAEKKKKTKTAASLSLWARPYFDWAFNWNLLATTKIHRNFLTLKNLIWQRYGTKSKYHKPWFLVLGKDFSPDLFQEWEEGAKEKIYYEDPSLGYFVLDSGVMIWSKEQLSDLLQLLNNYRSERPLDGIFVIWDLNKFRTDIEGDLNLVYQSCSINFPINFLIAGIEKLTNFADFATEIKGQNLGWENNLGELHKQLRSFKLFKIGTGINSEKLKNILSFEREFLEVSQKFDSTIRNLQRDFTINGVFFLGTNKNIFRDKFALEFDPYLFRSKAWQNYLPIFIFSCLGLFFSYRNIKLIKQQNAWIKASNLAILVIKDKEKAPDFRIIWPLPDPTLLRDFVVPWSYFNANYERIQITFENFYQKTFLKNLDRKLESFWDKLNYVSPNIGINPEAEILELAELWNKGQKLLDDYQNPFAKNKLFIKVNNIPWKFNRNKKNLDATGFKINFTEAFGNYTSKLYTTGWLEDFKKIENKWLNFLSKVNLGLKISLTEVTDLYQNLSKVIELTVEKDLFIDDKISPKITDALSQMVENNLEPEFINKIQQIHRESYQKFLNSIDLPTILVKDPENNLLIPTAEFSQDFEQLSKFFELSFMKEKSLSNFNKKLENITIFNIGKLNNAARILSDFRNFKPHPKFAFFLQEIAKEQLRGTLNNVLFQSIEENRSFERPFIEWYDIVNNLKVAHSYLQEINKNIPIAPILKSYYKGWLEQIFNAFKRDNVFYQIIESFRSWKGGYITDLYLDGLEERIAQTKENLEYMSDVFGDFFIDLRVPGLASEITTLREIIHQIKDPKIFQDFLNFLKNDLPNFDQEKCKWEGKFLPGFFGSLQKDMLNTLQKRCFLLKMGRLKKQSSNFNKKLQGNVEAFFPFNPKAKRTFSPESWNEILSLKPNDVTDDIWEPFQIIDDLINKNFPLVVQVDNKIFINNKQDKKLIKNWELTTRKEKISLFSKEKNLKWFYNDPFYLIINFADDVEIFIDEPNAQVLENQLVISFKSPWSLLKFQEQLVKNNLLTVVIKTAKGDITFNLGFKILFKDEDFELPHLEPIDPQEFADTETEENT